jgi:predicted nucleic acid-binding protein
MINAAFHAPELKQPNVQIAASVMSAGERHRDVLDVSLTELPHPASNIVHDLHSAVPMREHAISRIVSRETGFARFPFLQMIDPLAA